MNKIIRTSWITVAASIIIYVFFYSKIYNLGIGFRDEGFLYLNVNRILSGEIPYRDFFMTTTPGSFYLAAFLSKFFGLNLITGRILFGIIGILCIILVNLIYKFNNFIRFVVSLAIGIYFLVPSAFGYYNVEALLFTLISFYFLCKGLDNKDKKSILISGVLVSIVFIFKQSYGGWAGLGFFLIILSERIRKYGFKDIYLGLYLLGCLIGAVPFAIYYFINNSLPAFVYYALIFSREVKEHRASFLFKSILSLAPLYIIFKIANSSEKMKRIFICLGVILVIFSIIFLGTGYFDLTRIYYIVFILFPILVLATAEAKTKNNLLRRSAVILLCLFFANAASGREAGTILCVSPIYIPSLVLYLEYINKKKYLTKTQFNILITLVVLLQAIIFSWNAIIPDGKIYASYTKQEMDSELEGNKFTAGIKISAEEKNELDRLLTNISKYPSDVKLVCFPYCPMMNPLTNRQSPSYYNFFYPEAFLVNDQNKVIQSLKNNEAIIIIQKPGKIEPEANFEDIRYGKLKKYLTNQYKKTFETENFVVYGVVNK